MRGIELGWHNTPKTASYATRTFASIRRYRSTRKALFNRGGPARGERIRKCDDPASNDPTRSAENAHVVTAVPSEADLARIKQRLPGPELRAHVSSGMRLDDLRFRDSYSHELAEIFVGADSQRKLMRAYREIVATLRFGMRRAGESSYEGETVVGL